MATYDEFFSLLHNDHLQVMDMLNQMKEMPESDYSRREEMFTRLKASLVPHMKGEEKSFYATLRQNKSSKKDAMVAMEEHHIAEVSFMELDRMSKQDEIWAAKLMVFQDLIKHHVEEEEGKIFQEARNVLSEDQMQNVMQNFQNEKMKAMGEAAGTRST